MRVQGKGSRLGLSFGILEPVRTWADALGHDHEPNRRFVVGCVECDVFLHGYTCWGPPGPAGFSLAHTPDNFAQTRNVVEAVAAHLARNGVS